MIDQITIDRIIDAANIVDVVSEYVTLRRAGANYKGLCPFHDDKTPSFHVSPAKGICKCFACGEGGNAVHFIMKMEQLGYIDALKFLGKKYGIEVEEKDITPEQRAQMNEREAMFNTNEWASQYYHRMLKEHPDGKAIGMAYFRSRGFRDDIVEKFRLGFSLDQYEALSKEATKDGYNIDYLIKTGLCFRRDNGQLTDRYRSRVMFPWFNISGKVVAFGGRVLDSRTKGVSQKYINSPESEIYNKGRELYGIYQAKKQIAKEDRVYMVEGYTDVISMHQCGIENVVANSGTALTEPQIRLLHRYTNNITLLYDGDEAGIHAALRGTDMLLAEGMNVKILLLPDGDDPDSFARKHNATEFRQYVEAHQTDFIIFKTNLLLKDAGRDPLKHAQLTQSIVFSISVIPDEILRAAYVHECAELLQQNEALLLREIAKNKQAAQEELKKQQQIEQDRQRRIEERKAEEGKEEKENKDKDATEELGNSNPASQSDISSTSNISSQSIPSNVSSPSQEIPARYHGIERMIMTLIVRYGEHPINLEGGDGNDENQKSSTGTDPENTISLIKYVADDLNNDGIELLTPLYNRMLHQAAEHMHEENFVASRFFLNNPDVEISQEAASLMTERYQLAKNNQMTVDEKTMVPEYITHLMLDYKFMVIDDELKECQKRISDPQLCASAMQQYMELSQIQRELARRLGDRILIN